MMSNNASQNNPSSDGHFSSQSSNGHMTVLRDSGTSGLPKYPLLFATFFKIGAFTLGGGYAMIPIIEEEVVNKHHWVSKGDFLDLIAIAQSCPGVTTL